MKKRIVSMLLAIVMVVGLVPGMALTANAAYTGSPVLKSAIASQETPDDVTLTYEFQSSSWYPTAGTTYKLYADTNKTTEAGSVVLTDGTTPTLEVTLNEAPVRDTRYYLTATAPNSDESKFTSVVVKTYRITNGFAFSYGEYSDIGFVDFFQDQMTYDIVLPPATAKDAAISVEFETANGATVTYSGDTALSNGSGSITAAVVSETPVLSYTYTINFTTMNLDGQGTETEPYLITSSAELKQLADCLNNCGAAPMDTDSCGYGNFCGYYFRLTKDIDLDGIEWEPIGHSGSTYFAGHFDGDDHTISNMTTTGRTAPGEDGTDCSRFNAAGLFGWCAFGSVKNVTVDNADVTAIGQNEMGYAGGLIAVPFGCSVINCHVKNSTIESGRVPITNSNFAGGVAGMAAAATFEECSSVNNTVRGTMYVGGFIGSQEGESNYTDCYVADTTIESVMVSSSFNCNVGGFASASQDGDYVMTNCFVYDCKTQVADGANTNQYEEGVLNKYEWSSDIALTTNCYYYTTQTYEDGTAATAVAKTTEEFADGTVLAALNGDRTGEDVVWMQGEDYPVFKVPTYTVTATANPTAGGTVTGGGEYEEGTTVTLTATANEGYTFVNWAENGSEVSADASFTFTASGDRNLTAVFKKVQLITLNLESPRGLKETLEIDINDTVADLKEAVADKCNVTFGSGSEYRLFGEDLSYPNSKLDDDTKVLKDIGFADGQTIHLEKSTSWDASGNEPIKIFGLIITGGKGSQEPYGDYTNVDYYWNYYYKTITIKSTAGITISGTGELNTNIIIKKPSGGGYTNLTISDLSLTNDDGSCINVQGNSWVKLTVKGNNTLTSTGASTDPNNSTDDPALTLTNSGAYLKIMSASTGTLTATTNIAGQPGIGTYDNTSSVWGVEINGGTIIANGGEGGAGIRAQAVCIDGGNVTSNGGIDGYGSNALYPYSIKILGGTVTASSESGKALSVVPNLDSYMYYTATASTNKDGTGAVSYDAEANDTYKYFKIEPRTVFAVSIDSAIENGTVVADKASSEKDGTITLTATPDTGYVLDSLKYNDGSADTAITGSSFAMPAADVVVTAVFKPISYSIGYTMNGGNASNPATYTIETETFTLTNPTKTGYTFKGWSGTDLTGDENQTAAIAKGSTGDRAYTANWTANTYTVKFDANGGIGTMADQNFTYDAAQNLTANAFTYANKHFNGWKDSGGNSYSNSQSVSNLTPEANGTVTLYAQWSDKPAQEITFDTTDRSATYGDGTLEARNATATGTVTYSSSNPDVATVDTNGVVTVLKAGEVTITASAAETDDYAAGSASYKLTISKKKLTITVANKSVYVGSQKPELSTAASGTDYTISGLVGSDTVTVTLSYATEPDMTKAGEYAITATGTDVSGNYTFDVVDGKLTVSYRPSSGGSSNTTSKTEKNEDGSTTTTTTNKTTGTVTETTKYPDGSTTTVETKKDGSATETSKNSDGTTGTVVTDKDGNVTEVSAKVPAAAVKAATESGEAVKLPVEVEVADDADKAVEIEVDVPTGGAKVDIPVEDVTSGTVVVVVNKDGTEEIVKKSTVTEDGVVVALDEDATLKIVDNSKHFVDVHPVDHWAETAVDFVVARTIYSGTSATTFHPDNPMTRGMLAVVLHNMEDNPDHAFDDVFCDVAEGSWYEDAIHWAADSGIVSGYGNGLYGPNDNITREQLAVMLWRYAGSPDSDQSLAHFKDAHLIASYAETALAWANENGIINGKGDGILDPKGNATRAQVAQMLMNYLQK